MYYIVLSQLLSRKLLSTPIDGKDGSLSDSWHLVFRRALVFVMLPSFRLFRFLVQAILQSFGCRLDGEMLSPTCYKLNCVLIRILFWFDVECIWNGLSLNGKCIDMDHVLIRCGIYLKWLELKWKDMDHVLIRCGMYLKWLELKWKMHWYGSCFDSMWNVFEYHFFHWW